MQSSIFLNYKHTLSLASYTYKNKMIYKLGLKILHYNYHNSDDMTLKEHDSIW